MDSILTESEKSRYIYLIINKLAITEDMLHMQEAFDFKENSQLEDENFLYFLKRHGIVEEVFPLHSKSRSKEGYQEIWKVIAKSWRVPSTMIRDYYGEKIAIYFVWMDFLACWLIVPAAVAVLISLISNLMEIPVAKNKLYSLFSFAMAFWATLFVVYWKKRTQELQI
jgi:hypothetical protein